MVNHSKENVEMDTAYYIPEARYSTYLASFEALFVWPLNSVLVMTRVNEGVTEGQGSNHSWI